jgi:hypothetical protein
MTIPENMDSTQSMVLDDRKASAEKITDTLATSEKKQILHMRELSAKCVPKYLDAVQECDAALASDDILI